MTKTSRRSRWTALCFAVLAAVSVAWVTWGDAASPSASAQPGSRICGSLFADKATGNLNARFAELAIHSSTSDDCTAFQNAQANATGTKTSTVYRWETCEDFSTLIGWSKLSEGLKAELANKGQVYDPLDICNATSRARVQNVWWTPGGNIFQVGLQ